MLGMSSNIAGVLVVLFNPHNNFTKYILLCLFYKEADQGTGKLRNLSTLTRASECCS